jgi:CRP-like cAMP-binding protein
VSEQPHKRNNLLAALPADDYKALTERATIIPLKYTKQLYLQDAPIDSVYFPLDCVVSLLVGVTDGPKVEMATIGNEGMVGFPTVLDVRRALGDNVVQVPGDAVRLDANIFRNEVNTRPAVRRLMLRYLYALMCQMVYAGSCNHLHSMEERCARWLLQTHDRVGKDTFPLTQDYLAQMLAVRRATVNVAIAILKKADFIQYVRGRITIINRSGLESAACPCYLVIRQEYERLSTYESSI